MFLFYQFFQLFPVGAGRYHYLVAPEPEYFGPYNGWTVMKYFRVETDVEDPQMLVVLLDNY